MRPIVSVFVAFAAAIVPAAIAATGAQNVSVNTRGEPIERCDQLQITYDDGPAARGEQLLSVSQADAPTLTVAPTDNGGIYVVGWDRAEYAITACKAAETPSVVEQIKVGVRRGTISATGPRDRWLVYLIVKAPRSAGLALETNNGPISVDGMTGTVNARTTNGPIAVKHSSGRIDARAQNGPVSFAGGSGEVSLTANNGPIRVRLDGDQWQKGSLSARAQNGPLHVSVPTAYRSGVRVESAGHSPWSCRGEGCQSGRKDWDDNNRWVELGTGPTLVRISTVNGPVKIDSSSMSKD